VWPFLMNTCGGDGGGCLFGATVMAEGEKRCSLTGGCLNDCSRVFDRRWMPLLQALD